MTAGELDQQLLKALQDIRGWQDFTQGQVDALRIAAFAALRVAQVGNPDLLAQVRHALDAHRKLIADSKAIPPGQVAGFDAALHDLEAGSHVGNPTDIAH